MTHPFGTIPFEISVWLLPVCRFAGSSPGIDPRDEGTAIELERSRGLFSGKAPPPAYRAERIAIDRMPGCLTRRLAIAAASRSSRVEHT
jgi:hypothetical protein